MFRRTTKHGKHWLTSLTCTHIWTDLFTKPCTNTTELWTHDGSSRHQRKTRVWTQTVVKKLNNKWFAAAHEAEGSLRSGGKTKAATTHSVELWGDSCVSCTSTNNSMSYNHHTEAEPETEQKQRQKDAEITALLLAAGKLSHSSTCNVTHGISMFTFTETQVVWLTTDAEGRHDCRSLQPASSLPSPDLASHWSRRVQGNICTGVLSLECVGISIGTWVTFTFRFHFTLHKLQ